MNNIVDMFLEQAEATPDASALLQGRRTLSYLELDNASENIAKAIEKRGLTGEVVGIYSSRSIEFIASALGIMKAGCVYVSLDSELPLARLQKIISDADIKLLLSQPDIPALQISEGAEIVYVEIDDIKTSSPLRNERKVSDDRLAYVIFTSGSTGEPKGTKITHKCLANFVNWMVVCYNFKSGTKTSWISRPAFDASLFEIWPFIASGGLISIPPDELLYEPPKLLEWIKENNLDTCFMPTPLAESCLDLKWPEECRLKYLFSGGDALRKAPKPDAPFKMFDHYGPSECTVVSTYAEITPEQSKNKFPNIGFPISGAKVYILNESLNPVEDGQVGEIFIAGAGVGDGYLKDPELTKAKFLPDKFSKTRDAKMYKTGDLGARLKDGSIEFHGRTDRMVKIRGFRIELGEIESLILKQSYISQAAVVLKQGQAAKRIVAFAETLDNTSDCLEKLKKVISENLPSYMMPSKIIFLDSLPKTLNGKIDRSALASGEYFNQSDNNENADPKELSDKEKAIFEIWEEVLGDDNFSADTNFFDAGGHSLKAFRAVSRINERFGSKITVRHMFDYPTIRSLAEIVKGSEQFSVSRIEHKGLNKAPATPWQVHMWLLDSFSSEINVCNIICSFEISGKLDVELLELSVKKLVEFQHCLRLKFLISDSYLIKEKEDYLVDYVFHDLSDISAEEAEDLSEEIICGFRDCKFDLKEGNVCRFALLKYDSQTYTLLASFHHAVFDGFSLAVFVKQLKGIYETLLVGGDAENLRPEISYFDYSLWLEKWLGSQDAQEQKKFWLDKLDGIKGLLTLDCTLPRPEAYTFEGRRHYFNFGKERSRKIEDFCSKNSITEYMLLLTAYSLLLRGHTDTNEIIVGSPIANRPDLQTEQLVGLFINGIVQRLNILPENTIISLLDTVKKDTLQAFANQNYPLENHVHDLNLVKYPSAHPLFQHLFSFQNAHIPEAELGSSKMRVDDIGNNTAKVDLALVLELRNGNIEGWFEYNTNIFTSSVVDELSDELFEISDKIISSPDSKISDLISLEPFNESKMSELENEPIDLPESFVRFAGLSPDKPAVCADSNFLTYSELDKITDLLATKLINAGVKADSRVAVFYDSSLEFIAAALAVLKAGGGYVPVDPGYPDERIDYIIQNAQVSCAFAPAGTVNKAFLEGITCFPVDLDQLKNTERKERICVDVSEDSLAYVIYTSGSTGNPKGVEVERRNLKNLIEWQLNYYQINARDRASNLARSSFDTSVSEIWPYLMAGASVYIPQERIVLNPKKMIEWLCASRITICDMTTQLAELAVFENWPSECSLRVLKTGGERLKKRPPAGLSFDLYNEYGPTECTVIATSGKVSPACAGGEFPDIGVAISGNKAHILGADLKPVAKGSEGELCISGKGVARGYIGLDEEMEERFIQSPFDPAARMYRTGDLVRRKEDGNLEYIGRKDSQIQIRGFRVEPGEIEKAVTEYGGVKEAAVISSDEQDSEIKLLCFVAADDINNFSEEKLLSYLKEKLPDYMQPAQIFTVEKIPLNHNGKTDRDALLEIAKEDVPQPNRTDSKVVMPRNPMEEVLWDIWEQLLGRSDFGVYENFFDLGGHSLMLIKMDSLLSERGLYVGIEKILQYPEIARLSGCLDFRVAGEACCSGEKCLIELNKGSRGRLPVYFIHSLSGDVLGYANLVHHLGKDQPCYGFQSAGLSDLDKAHKTLPEMAEHYVKLMLDFQPEGPYLLAGWCFGGFIAYEMAQMLKGMGRQVGMLLMVDAPSMPPADINLSYYFDIACNLASLGPSGMFKFIISYLKKHKQFESVEEIIGERFSMQDNEIKNKYVSNREGVYKINLNAARSHKIHKYNGEIILCTAAKREHWLLRGDTLGWKNFANNVELKVIPGDHGFIIRKSKVLPKFIREKIDQVINAN
ncbi:amino acid adenylation domain-containing protein [Sedimentisphaera salicampi]|uniref:amino acid adenylation domain-containing protein n=1 Tax=Sedimentisphaera salicampi TaxID=1941349 RepID=UPI000B9A8141|nr:non-ribosomal peptide synthetase [Sedimentisphaera salicampi]OXU16053.1 Linear gramicidin synthase subunit D [Sedimentisphaera salicampi]